MLTYICSDLYSYRSKLKILFQQSETGSETKSQLADVITKIMQSLQNNLNEKSKQYKDPALSHIFLMNNLHYMVMSVRRYVFWSFRSPSSGVLAVCLFNNLFCLTAGHKPRIYLAMTGFRGTVRLYSKMRVSTRE